MLGVVIGRYLASLGLGSAQRSHLSWDLLKVTGSPCNSGHRPGFLNVESGRKLRPTCCSPLIFQVPHSAPGRLPVFLFKARSYSAPCIRVGLCFLPVSVEAPEISMGKVSCALVPVHSCVKNLTYYHSPRPYPIFIHRSSARPSSFFLVLSVCSVLYLEGRGMDEGRDYKGKGMLVTELGKYRKN